MRVRKKRWTQSELDTNERLVTPFNVNRGRWREYFGNDNDIHAEVGCGMGRWITQSAALCPGINFVALERQRHVIVSGMRASRQFEIKPAFVICDADDLLEVFAPGELSRIYVNFCDPWPRPRWYKRRLTHRRFLEKYRIILRTGGGLFFKTDNMPLFDWSLSEFKTNGWSLENVTRDLHASKSHHTAIDAESQTMDSSKIADRNRNDERVCRGVPMLLMTEYEEKFFLKGVPIYSCEAYTRD